MKNIKTFQEINEVRNIKLSGDDTNSGNYIGTGKWELENDLDHVQSNILASSWVDSVSNDLQMEVEEKTPLMLELFDKRQEELGQKNKR